MIVCKIKTWSVGLKINRLLYAIIFKLENEN